MSVTTLDSSNARVAVTGAIWVAPAGTPAPADADTALASPWVNLGYVSEDGVTETRDRSADTIRAWQNGDTLREVITEADLTFQFVLAETKPEVIALFYGTTVDATTGSVKIVPAATGGRQSFVIDVVDGEEYIRAHIPEGEVTEVGDHTLAHGELMGYDLTVKAYPSATIVTADGQNAAAQKWYSAFGTGTVTAAGDRITDAATQDDPDNTPAERVPVG